MNHFILTYYTCFVLCHQQADFAMCILSRSEHRLKYVDFSHFTFLDSLTFITTKPGLTSLQWIALYPFSKALWLIIISTICGLSLIIYQFAKILLKFEEIANEIAFKDIFIVMLQLFLKQCKWSDLIIMGTTLVAM